MLKDSTYDNEKPSIACYRTLIVMLFISRHSLGSQDFILVTHGLFNNDITRRIKENN